MSDRLGTTTNPAITNWLAKRFSAAGLSVKINDPYRGGDLIGTFGQPARGRHSGQIELNRALYLNEAISARSLDFNTFRATLAAITHDFCSYTRSLSSTSI